MRKPPKWKSISSQQVEGLARVGCTDAEIADLLGLSPAALGRHFAQPLLKGRAALKMKLRKAQVDTAVAGNASLLVWLGKQTLGQSEKQEAAAGDLYPAMTDAELAELARRRGLASPHWSRQLLGDGQPEPPPPDQSPPDVAALKPIV